MEKFPFSRLSEHEGHVMSSGSTGLAWNMKTGEGVITVRHMREDSDIDGDP